MLSRKSVLCIFPFERLSAKLYSLLFLTIFLHHKILSKDIYIHIYSTVKNWRWNIFLSNEIPLLIWHLRHVTNAISLKLFDFFFLITNKSADRFDIKGYFLRRSLIFLKGNSFEIAYNVIIKLTVLTKDTQGNEIMRVKTWGIFLSRGI